METNGLFLTLQLNSHYFLIIAELITNSLNNIVGTLSQILAPLFGGILLLIIITIIFRFGNKNFKQWRINFFLNMIFLVVFTEIHLEFDFALITLGLFQSQILVNQIEKEKIVSFLYLCVRIVFFEYQNKRQFYFIVVNMLLLVVYYQIKGKQMFTQESIPLNLVKMIHSRNFIIFLNSPRNIIYKSFLKDEKNDIFNQSKQNQITYCQDDYNAMISTRSKNNPDNQLNYAIKFLYNTAEKDLNRATNALIVELQNLQISSINVQSFVQEPKLFVLIQETEQTRSTEEEIATKRKMTINKEDDLYEYKKKYRDMLMNRVYKIIHDMKTPMNAIINLQACLQDQIEFSVFEKYVKPSLNSCKLLMNLLQDIQDTAQLEKSKIRIVPRSFNLEKFISKTLMIFEIQATTRQISLDSYIDPAIAKKITTDKNRLRQILMNLISNALKYTHPKGTIQVNFKQNRRHIEAEVSDTGIGINTEQLSRLFKDFQRVMNQENDRLNPLGVGLGLQISYELSQLLGSSNGIKVDSIYGTGSRFSFEFINYDDSGLQDENIDSPLMFEGLKLNICQRELNVQPKPKFGYINDRAISITKEQLELLVWDRSKSKRLDITNNNFISQNSIPISLQIQSQQRKSHYAFSPGNRNKSYIKLNGNPLDHPQPSIILNTFNSNINLAITPNNYNTNIKKNSYQSVTSQLILNAIQKWKSQLQNLNLSPILIVDDNEFSGMSLQMLLESLGIDAEFSICGQEAIKMIQERNSLGYSYLIVFLDIEMPFMDGYETASQIFKSNPDINLVACTGWEDKQILERLKNSGIFNVIQKPVKKVELKQLLKSILKIE